MRCKYNFIFKSQYISKDVIDGSSNLSNKWKRNSIVSNYSSSDDGGFLPRKRRPIVSCPSQLSLTQSIESEQSNYSRLLKRFNLQYVLSHRGIEEQKNEIQELYRDVQQNTTPVLYINTPIQNTAQIHSSSPANVVLSPQFFSDLSSVHPNSIEHLSSQQNSSRPYHYDRYFHTLPRLNAIIEENTRFKPVRPVTPDDIPLYQNYPISSFDFRSRYQPIFRSKRSFTDLSYPIINIAPNFIDTSPSDSSGIGSKNTSSQHQSSNSSGLLNELRFIPSYRLQPSIATIQRYRNLHSPSQYPISYWLDLIARLRANQTESGKQRAKWNKELDVGSVDGHYEFDPSTPTPSVSTPTGLEFIENGLSQRKKIPRYDNIDTRIQAMKEEFFVWRKKHAAKHELQIEANLESIC